MSDRLLTADVVFSSPEKLGLVPYTRQHGARLEERGEFPQRYQCGDGRVAWSEREILEWIRSRPRGPLAFRGRRPDPEVTADEWPPRTGATLETRSAHPTRSHESIDTQSERRTDLDESGEVT
jgi:predicted DNA-binding transcriptional regulator AlpA